MTETTKAYDVFITHSANDTDLARQVAAACRTGGLEAFVEVDPTPGVNVEQVLWEALAESRALLAILSGPEPTPSMAIELGAARAWNKPIYGVVVDPTIAHLPAGLSGMHLYTINRMDEVIRAINLSSAELTDSDRVVLAKLYSELGIPVDQLAMGPWHLEALARAFSSLSHKAISGERLLSELMRMRKQGKFMGRIRNGSQTRKRPALIS